MKDQDILELVEVALDDVAPGWRDSVDDFGLHIKMKDLSIDSVATMEMVGRIEEELGVTFADEQLAQVSKLDDLATLIREATA
ncbi:MAG: acyl carrier protein [Myxococcota bacterium]